MLNKFDELLNRLHAKYGWFTLATPKHSIKNYELYWVYCFLEKTKPSLLFESGVYKGRSTLILAEIMKPYGQVIAASYHYPGEQVDLFPFVDDYPHLTIVQGRGEDVVSKLPDVPMVAVVDGPKPAGQNWGRPGWTTLIEALLRLDTRAVFQHDVANPKPKEEFERIPSLFPGYQVGYIPPEYQHTLYDSPIIFDMNIGIIKPAPKCA